MTRISGGQRAQAVVPAAPAPTTQAPAAPTAAPVQAEAQRIITGDDRHGAASRAFDDPAALALKARVAGQGSGDGIGFGHNASDRPLRSAPGAPSASAWSNPGNGILAQLTLHPPVGRINEFESLARAGAACVLAVAVMGGSRSVIQLVESTLTNPLVRHLSDPQREDLRALSAAVKSLQPQYAQLVKMQALLARAANLTDELSELLKQTIRPPATTLLKKDEVNQLKLYERMIAQRQELDGAQTTLLSRLLTVGNGRPMPVMRAWDPDVKNERRTLRVKMLPPESAGDAAQLYEDEVAVLARMADMIRGHQEAVELPAPDAPSTVLQQMLGSIVAHEAALVRVHRSAREDHDEADRVIVLGRRKDGMAYLYNPDPRGGDFTLVFGRVGKNQPAEFTTQLQRYNERIRDDVDGNEATVTFVRSA